MSYKHSFHTQTSSTFPVFQEEGRLTRPRRKRRLPRQRKKFFSTHIRRFTPETCSFVSLRLVYFSPYFLIFRVGEMELPLENLLQQWKEPQRFTILHEGTSNLEEDECSRKQPKEPKAVKQPTVVRSPILKVCVLLSLSIIWFWNEHHCYATSCPWLAICNVNKHLHYAALSQ
jgi:hypothetical protein